MNGKIYKGIMHDIPTEKRQDSITLVIKPETLINIKI